VEKRTRNKSITYFRLWCVDDQKNLDALEPIVQGHARSGMRVRTCVRSKAPDLSLIWVPRFEGASIRDSDESEDVFDKLNRAKDFEPLCAITFKARGGKELDGMTLHGPQTEKFEDLRVLFQQVWLAEGKAPSVVNR
jgi:hypothetical protein